MALTPLLYSIVIINTEEIYTLYKYYQNPFFTIIIGIFLMIVSLILIPVNAMNCYQFSLVFIIINFREKLLNNIHLKRNFIKDNWNKYLLKQPNKYLEISFTFTHFLYLQAEWIIDFLIYFFLFIFDIIFILIF